jgi:ABC-type microcin C transport system permease subunit YejB
VTSRTKLIRAALVVLMIVPFATLTIFGTAIPTPLAAVLIVVMLSSGVYSYRRGWVKSKFAPKNANKEPGAKS